MQLALKINVDTFRGTLQGVPRLVDILRRHHAGATFCFAVGADRTGCLPKKVSTTRSARDGKSISKLEHYGFKSLLYGSVLPGPDIGRRCREILTATATAGFETAVHGWDLAAWIAKADKADATWTEVAMRQAHERYIEIFGESPLGHAAPGWQMNPHALRLTQRLGYHWASDGRGTHPHLPVWNGEVVRCPQLPTTLPTIDELVGSQGITADNVHDALLGYAVPSPAGHVMTIQAELEGMRFEKSFELVLTGLRERGFELVSLGQLRNSLDIATLPRHEVITAEAPGRHGQLMTQGPEFLAQWKDAA